MPKLTVMNSTSDSLPNRRGVVARLCCLPIAAALGAGLVRAADKKETAWSELMPKDWDPMKAFRPADLDQVAHGSSKESNMMRQMHDFLDNAPTNPKMDGVAVRLPGYVVPLEEVKGELKEFLLVPYFGACIHSPPPPANQIVHVVAAQPLKLLRTMDAVWVSGTLKVQRGESAMGASGYLIQGPAVEPYVAKPRR